MHHAFTRIGFFALRLCPLAFLTSMAAMEVFSGLLFVSAFGLLILDLKQHGLGTLTRIYSGNDLPLWGYVAVSLLGILLLVEDFEVQLDAVSSFRWILLFYGYHYFFVRFIDASWERYLPVFACVVTALGAFTVLQFMTGWEIPRSDRKVIPTGEFYRAVGFFNIPLTLASIMGMSACMLAGFTASYWQKINARALRLAGICAIGSVAGMAGVIVSLTRGAWLAAAFTAVIGAGIIKRSWALIALLIILVVSILGYFSNDAIHTRANSIFSEHSESNEHRKALWAANLAMIKDHPLLGLGAEQNISSLPEYYPRVDRPSETFIGHAHNNLIQIWAGQGIFALLFYLWFSGYFLWAGWRITQQQDTSKFFQGIGYGSIYAQIYFHMAGMTECNFIDLKVNHLLIFIWALTSATHWRLQTHKPLSTPSSG